MDEGILYAYRAKAAVDFGEFGDSENYTDDTNMVDIADQRFLNWTYWEYYTTTASTAPGLLLNDHQSGSVSNARQGMLDALVVPYPEAVTGTPKSYSLDRSHGVMHFSYSTTPVDKALSCRGAATIIFVPSKDYPHGYSVNARGARVVSAPTSPWIELVARSGSHVVRVTVTRATHSTTEVPTTAYDTHAPIGSCHRS